MYDVYAIEQQEDDNHNSLECYFYCSYFEFCIMNLMTPGNHVSDAIKDLVQRNLPIHEGRGCHHLVLLISV